MGVLRAAVVLAVVSFTTTWSFLAFLALLAASFLVVTWVVVPGAGPAQCTSGKARLAEDSRMLPLAALTSVLCTGSLLSVSTLVVPLGSSSVAKIPLVFSGAMSPWMTLLITKLSLILFLRV